MVQMDAANRALCYVLRFPPKGVKKTSFPAIISRKLVVNKRGRVPSQSAMSEAALTYKVEKGTRGRKKGFHKTTKADDRKILKTFHKQRPPGHYVNSRIVHTALPKKVMKKICKRTVRNRLADKGFVPTKKINKKDAGPKNRQRRFAFAKSFEGDTPAQWETRLQGVGDFKDFTWYPTQLRPRFAQLKSSWTYMKQEERLKPAFVRPKKWFSQKEWKRVKKHKIFGLTATTGQSLVFPIPTPWDSSKWAALVRSKLGPFLKKTFPNRTSFQILLDGESLLHAPPAKAAMKEFNITLLPKWPPHSPELNPQENVWPWAEDELRRIEKAEGEDETFETFQTHVLTAVRAYPSYKKLVGSMSKRIAKCIKNNGGPIDQ